MLSFGGMNDFNQIMGDLIIYDLEKDMWVENIKVLASKIPPTTHSSACSVFYPQRYKTYYKSLCNLDAVDWSHVKDFILQEGFYIFGGFTEGAFATNELWILKSETENLKWIKGNTMGQPPEPRY
jgi:hypothetical protein